MGKPKNLGQITADFDENFVFGKSLQPKDVWNVAKCIRGEATYYEAKNDPSLGKSTRFGTRNVTKSGDQDRVFGTPTIRTDIVKPVKKSVADPNVNCLIKFNIISEEFRIMVMNLQSFICYSHKNTLIWACLKKIFLRNAPKKK